MLSLPDDWDYSFNGLVTISKEGKTAIRSMINELKSAKYIKITQSRNEKGYFQYDYDVFEIPYDMTIKMMNYPTPENRGSVCRTSENQPQINTNIINNEEQIDKKDKIDSVKVKLATAKEKVNEKKKMKDSIPIINNSIKKKDSKEK